MDGWMGRGGYLLVDEKVGSGSGDGLTDAEEREKRARYFGGLLVVCLRGGNSRVVHEKESEIAWEEG